METEYKWWGKPKEYYVELHNEIIDRAFKWHETGENTTMVAIKENSLEEHFEVNWDQFDTNYRDEIEGWRGSGKLIDLKVIESPNGERTFLVDTSDLVIGKPEDTFFFHMVGTCWVVVVDFRKPDGEVLRAGYHMPGITVNKNFSAGSMVEKIGTVGKVERISVMFNGYKGDSEDIGAVKRALQPEIPISFIDLTKVFYWPAQDVFLKDEQAEIYHNEGDYDLETDTASVRREYSGKHKAFEANRQDD